MSLPHSSSAGAPARLLTLLPEVVADVAEQAFFAWADPCEDTKFAELAGNQACPWVHARVGFSGVVSGALEVLLPDDLARELGAAMVGGPAEEVQSEDVAGELANILCGALLTRADRNQPFELRPPHIARSAGVREEDRQRDHDLLFSVNDRPVLVRLHGSEA